MGRRKRRSRAGPKRQAMALMAQSERHRHRPDQLADATKIRRNPDSRRLVISAWDPADLDRMALRGVSLACSSSNVAAGKLSCRLYQRSADVFPRRALQHRPPMRCSPYGAQVTGLEPGDSCIPWGVRISMRNIFEQARSNCPREPCARPGRALRSIRRCAIFRLPFRG